MTCTKSIAIPFLALLLAAGTACSPSPGGPGAAGDDQNAGHGEAHEEGLVELPPEAAERAGLRLAAAVERLLAPELVTTGAVDFDQERLAHVSPRIPGRVDRARAALGARVAAGEVLVEIDSIELGQAKAAFLRARARTELARESYQREEDLFADRISAEQEMLAARAAFQEAQAELRAAEETLHLYGLSQAQVDALHYDDPSASIYALKAPFAGKVVEMHVTRGELVTPRDNLLLLADLSRVWIWIDVYEQDLAGVHLGDGVEVRVEAYPAELFRGQVSYLADRVDSATRTVRARIDVANPEEKLRPGMFARVRLSDPHAAGGQGLGRPTLAVPESALQRHGEGHVVFVPAGANRFRRREVETGREAGGWVEILSGLAAGEEVVVEGTFLLKSEAAGEQLGGGHGH